MLYQLVYSENNSLEGYINFSLAYYNTEDLQVDQLNITGVPVCRLVLYTLSCLFKHQIFRYKGFELPPCNLTHRHMVSSSSERYYRHQCDNDYSESFIWWHVIAAKLAFVLIFEHLVFFIKWIIEYIIPDVPHDVKLKVQREDYLQVQTNSTHFFPMQTFFQREALKKYTEEHIEVLMSRPERQASGMMPKSASTM